MLFEFIEVVKRVKKEFVDRFELSELSCLLNIFVVKDVFFRF